MTVAREALVAHLLEHSIRTGEFTLKSGRTSTWFCDSKQTVCRADGILLVAAAALEALEALEADSGPVTAIGGLAAGADPVAFGIAPSLPLADGICGRSAFVRSPRAMGWRAAWLVPCSPATEWWSVRTR